MNAYRTGISAACGLALLCILVIAVPAMAGERPCVRRDADFTVHEPDPRPDLTVSLMSTALQRPFQKVTITVTVKNNGDGPAPGSDCVVFVRNGHPPRQTLRTLKKAIRALDPGDQYAFSFSIKLGLGLYEVAATADRKKKIDEADETNNQTRIMIEGK
jgi:subtilase family serine protease